MAGATVIPLAAEESARAEAQAWLRFSAAQDRPDFGAAWLGVLCTQIDRVSGAMLLLGPEADGSYSPAAIWPNPSLDMRHLGEAAQRVLTERRGVVIGADGKSPPTRDVPAHIGYPIVVRGVLHGAVVLDVAHGGEASLQRALRMVHWASAWLIDYFRQKDMRQTEARVARLALAMDIVATTVQEQRLTAASLAVVNELAVRLKCDRVSVGFEAGDTVAVEAISHTAVFDTRMTMVRLIGEAMNEVLDLDTTLIYPPPSEEEVGAAAHTELARELRDVAICSVPLLQDGHAIGVLTLERTSGDAFDSETVELCKVIGGVLGPILNLKREAEHGIVWHLTAAVQEKAEFLFGPRHPGIKLVGVLVLALVAFFSLFSTTYRVAATTVVEGAVQRAISAPFDGFIAESFVRAGDTVHEGQVVARLDDRDLKLEHTRLMSEQQQLLRRQRQALAAQERGDMMVVEAELGEIDAQLRLIDDKLSRAVLRAPFNGVVVLGDLNQLLGTPVEQGKLLFQIAPLDAYRVILQVDEREIADIKDGQHGELALSGLPNQLLPFSVQQITPVASQQDGRNFFRVEARLRTAADSVRPGMEGVGKIEVGKRKLIWIWTHPLTDWLRTWLWKRMP